MRGLWPASSVEHRSWCEIGGSRSACNAGRSSDTFFFEVQLHVDQDLLRAAIAGERFAEYFYANSQDDAISDYLRNL